MEKAKRHTETSGEGVGSVFGDQPKLINGSGWSTALGDRSAYLSEAPGVLRLWTTVGTLYPQQGLREGVIPTSLHREPFPSHLFQYFLTQ